MCAAWPGRTGLRPFGRNDCERRDGLAGCWAEVEIEACGQMPDEEPPSEVDACEEAEGWTKGLSEPWTAFAGHLFWVELLLEDGCI